MYEHFVSCRIVLLFQYFLKEDGSSADSPERPYRLDGKFRETDPIASHVIANLTEKGLQRLIQSLWPNPAPILGSKHGMPQ
jgi:hypothetical protein